MAGSSPVKHSCMGLAVLFIKFIENYMLLKVRLIKHRANIFSHWSLLASQ